MEFFVDSVADLAKFRGHYTELQSARRRGNEISIVSLKLKGGRSSARRRPDFSALSIKEK